MFFSVLIAYLLGSIPFGYLIAKAKGRDIRRLGSGNIGTANTARVLGLPLALAVFLGDATKGLVGVLLGNWLGGGAVWGGLLGGLAAICGHNWSLFLGFRGGKGVATAFGVLLAISPLVALILMVIWIVAVAVTRISSVGSLLAAGLAPVVAWLVGLGWPQILFALAAGTMVIWRHKANIKRLLAGTELRIGDRV
ncbi:MAG: glycerol-3-phosphate 1-O-acyltransferase PlsY [bacterium]|jgi:glycerol-3-phosphate acyltransferase PlsY